MNGKPEVDNLDTMTLGEEGNANEQQQVIDNPMDTDATTEEALPSPLPPPPAPAPPPLPTQNEDPPSSLHGLFSQDGGDFLTNRFRAAGKGTSVTESTTSVTEPSSQPIGRVTRSQTAADRGSEKNAGLTGLYNLGNTCFMNSALQCMSNTKELKDYFVSGVYKNEVNTDNPLGMGGAMAKVFGELLGKLWGSGGGAVHPREFKTVLSRYSSQFAGYAQQDTQELLAFLLDGLHEDLNRIVKKPYVEAPDWEGGGLKEMIAFAHKQWEIYKMRNDSVIVDLFQGQYRSTLVCPTCKKVSIKFDPFMYLTLPIPNRKSIIRKVVFIGPNRPPTEAEVRLTGEMSIGAMKKKLAGWFGVSDSKLLIACDVFHKSFYRVYHDFDPANEIATNDVTYVYQLPKPIEPIIPASKSRLTFNPYSGTNIEALEEANSPPEQAEDQAIIPLFSVVVPNRNESSYSYLSNRKESFGQPFFISVPKDKLNDVKGIEEVVMQAYSSLATNPSSLKEYLESLDNEDEVAKGESNQEGDDVAQDWDMVEETKVTVLDGEEDLAEDTVAEISDAGETVRIVPDTRPNGGSSSTPQEVPKAESKKAFSLHFLVHREDQTPTTLKPDDYEKHGEELNKRAERLGLNDAERQGSSAKAREQWPLIYSGGALVCVWKEEAKEEFFKDNEDSWSIPTEKFIDPELESERSSTTKKFKKMITIEDCLNEFTKEEQLGESDPWYCPNCKEFKQATKKFDLWKVPDILVVHLKRFSGGRISRDKIDSLIDFPIDGLDLTDRVEGAKSVQQIHEEEGEEGDKLMESIGSLDANDDAVESDAPLYDLYAVDNHFGGLGGGHYTAYAKHPETEQWHYFDDSSVRPVQDPNDTKSPAAYLLFYRRRTTRPIGGKSREMVRQLVKEEGEKKEQAQAEEGAKGDDEMTKLEESPTGTISPPWDRTPSSGGRNDGNLGDVDDTANSDHGSMQLSNDDHVISI
ncbi:UCH-domain-containing protein [Meira miltonrushii]|uniref:Ubiquitin carboxyl-terminal hydrolase n=1 Tax=Meira miltonrushii TaxID=1280837 RepID=A0A316VBS6_9BASI|nr:UCH-domain-containing protein [Meira miltonrushii]PWN33431.1 UCH-domain-containing protein [Meira miltonrushii]